MLDITPESICFVALELGPAERAAFLDEVCAHDSALRARVEEMLASPPDPGDLPTRIPSRPVNALPQPGVPPTGRGLVGAVIAGRYKLLQHIGEGGMGSVWMADQLEPVKRRVAVKLINDEHARSREILARFEAERQAIALMDHPHIAKLLDAGTTGGAEERTLGSGRPYFVMELVKGVALNEFCDQNQLSVPERLRLFVQVCSAVQHAHQKGVIHRDLKPGNILVESHDGRPVPRVIDFGLAKAVGGVQLTDGTLFTRLGTVAGTPLYMAPEQATFNALDVDTRADVYALGVILYELLTGTTPIGREQLKSTPFDELLRVIRETDPPAPSKRLSSAGSKPAVAADRHTEPQKLGRLVRGELDWIVMKAIAKERDRRYGSASGLAGDVERFLNHEPVLAGPPGAAYRARKFVRRNRAEVTAAGLLLAALLAGVAGTSAGLIRAEHRRTDAEAARTDEAEQRGSAVANEARAVAAAGAEKAARGREAEQRKKAEGARDRTRQALDAMTSAVTGDSLATQKAVSPEQKAFLAEVLTYYQEFAGEQADDEESRAKTADATLRVGVIEYRLGRYAEAAAAFRLAGDGYARLAADRPARRDYRERSAASRINLGVAAYSLGRWAEAEGAYRQSLATFEKLSAGAADPAGRNGLARSHNNLGSILAERGDTRGAAEHFERALAVRKGLAADFPHEPEYRNDQATSHKNLGRLLARTGKPSEAEAEYRSALALLGKLVGDAPAEPAYRQELADVHNGFGILLLGLGDHAKAEARYRDAIRIWEELVADFPSVPGYRVELGGTYSNLGTSMRESRRPDLSLEWFEKAVRVLEAAYDRDRGLPFLKDYLRFTHLNRAQAYDLLGRPAEAIKDWDRGIELTPEAERPPHLIRLGGSCCNYGGELTDGGRPSESLVWFEKAIRTLAAVYEQDRKSAPAKEFLRNSHARRAIALDRLKKYDEALKDWDRAIELMPGGELRLARSRTRVRAGQVTEALDEVAALRKRPGAPDWVLYEFACVYAVASAKSAGQKDAHGDRAMGLLQDAVKAGFKDAARLTKDEDLDALRDRDDFKALLAEVTNRSK